MELREKIETINRQLIEHFGVDTITGQPMWRVVWANTVMEKRLMTHTRSGIELSTPCVMEVPKYQTVKDRYILERLIGLDPIASMEFAGEKLYYNPMWTFKDIKDNYLPPFFEGCKFIIDGVLHKEGKVNIGAIYLDPELDPMTKINRINGIVEELFGEHPGYTEKNPNTVIGFHKSADHPKG